MATLNIIRQDLLAARSEREEELATIDRVLQTLGQPERQSSNKADADAVREPSKELVEAVSRVLRDTHKIRNNELAERIGKSNRSTGRALTFLKRHGKVSYERNRDTGQIFWRWVQ